MWHYSEGFILMIMSFCSALGVGVTSTAEYFDMEEYADFRKRSSKRLNEVMRGMEAKAPKIRRKS